MNPFRLVKAFFSYLSGKLLPYQLRPNYILGKIRAKLEGTTRRLEESADKLHVEKPTKSRPWYRYILRALVFVAVVLLLAWLNRVLDLDKVLRSPWPVLHKYWLPLLFLLGCALYWLGLWLWRLLAPEKAASEFPDI